MGTTNVKVGESFGVEVIRGEKKLGNWTIVIEGSGGHTGGETDADTMARDFVDALAMAGQQIEHASITTNARQEILPRVVEANPE